MEMMLKTISITAAMTAIALAIAMLSISQSHRQCWEGECWNASLNPTPSFCGIISCNEK
jgi:hypothetical protein